MPEQLSLPCPHCACTKAHPSEGSCLDCWDGQQRLLAVNQHRKHYEGKACSCGSERRYTDNGRCAACTRDPRRERLPVEVGPATVGKVHKPMRIRGTPGEVDLSLF